MKKEGQKSPDYEVATELWIDEEIMSQEELRLIEAVLPDIIKKILNDDEKIGGE